MKQRKREKWRQWEWGSMFCAPGTPGLQAWVCSAELAVLNLHLSCPGAMLGKSRFHPWLCSDWRFTHTLPPRQDTGKGVNILVLGS